MDKKGGVSRFSVEYFLSHSDETIFQRYPSVLVFRKFMIAKKFMDMRDGEYQDFFIKFFCLTVLKILVGQHFRVSLISGIEKFYAEEGYVKIFRRIFLSRSNKRFAGEPFCTVFRKSFR